MLGLSPVDSAQGQRSDDLHWIQAWAPSQGGDGRSPWKKSRPWGERRRRLTLIEFTLQESAELLVGNFCKAQRGGMSGYFFFGNQEIRENSFCLFRHGVHINVLIFYLDAAGKGATHLPWRSY